MTMFNLTTIVLALLWLALVVRALFLDRSRGRRRCPKCAFDMEGTDSLVCSECGKAVLHERSLFRTRRHWRRAILISVVMLPLIAATLGAGWIRAGSGWKRAPDWLAVQLLFLKDDGLDREIIRRVEHAELSLADAGIVAAEGRRRLRATDRATIDSGYDLLIAFAETLQSSLGRQAIVNGIPVVLRGDATPTHPALDLCDFHPTKTVDVLLGRLPTAGPQEVKDISILLTALRHTEPRAQIALVGITPTDWHQSVQALLRGLSIGQRPSLTRRAPPCPATSNPLSTNAPLRGAALDLSLLAWFGREMEVLEADEIPTFAADLLLDPPPARSTGFEPEAVRAVALWIACGQDSEASWTFVRDLTDSPNPLLRATAVQQTRLYPWSTEIESILRDALTDPDESVRQVACETVEECTPDSIVLLRPYAESWYLSSTAPWQLLAVTERRSGFASNYIARGGDVDTILDGIADLLLEWSVEAVRPGPTPTLPGEFVVLDWIPAIDERDDRLASLIEPLFRVERPEDRTPRVTVGPMTAAVAHAVLTGDGTLATTAVLTFDPDFFGSTTQAIDHAFESLDQLDLLDLDLVVDRYIRDEDHASPKWMATYLHRHVKPETQAILEEMVRALAEDPEEHVRRNVVLYLEFLP